MLTNGKLAGLGIVLLLMTGLNACDRSQPGPAESAGKEIDRSIGNVSRKIDNAAEHVSRELSERGTKTGEAIDDAEITGKIKASIFAEPGLRSLQISVNTLNGVVTLSGAVDSVVSSNRAKALATSVMGVKEVDNQLVANTAG